MPPTVATSLGSAESVHVSVWMIVRERVCAIVRVCLCIHVFVAIVDGTAHMGSGDLRFCRV